MEPFELSCVLNLAAIPDDQVAHLAVWSRKIVKSGGGCYRTVGDLKHHTIS